MFSHQLTDVIIDPERMVIISIEGDIVELPTKKHVESNI